METWHSFVQQCKWKLRCLFPNQHHCEEHRGLWTNSTWNIQINLQNWHNLVSIWWTGRIRGCQFILFMQITTFCTYKTKPNLQVKAKKTVCITSKLALFSIFFFDLHLVLLNRVLVWLFNWWHGLFHGIPKIPSPTLFLN